MVKIYDWSGAHYRWWDVYVGIKKGKTMSIEKEVFSLVSEQLGVSLEEVSREKSFIEDLNADSLDLTELIMTAEERFNVEIMQEDAEKLRTVGDLVDYIANLKGPKNFIEHDAEHLLKNPPQQGKIEYLN